MSWLTAMWSLAAAACLTLAVMHLFVWAKHRQHVVPLLFSLMALGAAACGLVELTLMHTTSAARYEALVRWQHVPVFVLLVSMVWAVQTYFGTGRRWLAWTITGLWTLCLLVNFLSPHSLVFREISELDRSTTWFGEPFTLVKGQGNPWVLLAHLAVLLILGFVADASWALWRQGNRRRAGIVGGSILLFLVLAGLHSGLVDEGVVRTPYMISFAYLAIVAAMSYELGSDVVRASLLSREVTMNVQRWRSLLENVALAVLGISPEAKINYANPFFEKHTGFRRDELLGRPVTDFVAAHEAFEVEERLREAAVSGPRPHSRWTLRDASGKQRLFAWSSVSMLTAEGQFAGILAVGEDISEREQAFQDLKAERERMGVVLSALDSGLTLLDRDLNVVWVNEKIRKMFPQGELTGRKCYEICENRSAPCENCGALEVFADGQIHVTQRQNAQDGRWFHIASHPVKDPSGEVVQVLESSMDITERIESRQRLESALEEVRRLQEQLERENIYLQEEVRAAHGFDEIIGDSDALKYVLHKIPQVADTNMSVLIEGETGVGKELVAHAIHQRSSRKDRPLIKVNCAALPATLVESELFGYEKGAFTGATQSRRGRFELAHQGTLFLDEVGELPLELQPKLLRVLQDGEFQRLGSEQTRQVDVRLIAATNRSLSEAVKAGRFREDLFYRLCVFPLTVPPLRQRREDIPLLVAHFVKVYAAKRGKVIEEIPSALMDRLTRYSWPGNIRELQNVIERAVLTSMGKVLKLADRLGEDTDFLRNNTTRPNGEKLEAVERTHIQQVLNRCDGRIAGPGGAAEILGINPSTLRSRIKKLRIQ